MSKRLFYRFPAFMAALFAFIITALFFGLGAIYQIRRDHFLTLTIEDKPTGRGTR